MSDFDVIIIKAFTFNGTWNIQGTFSIKSNWKNYVYVYMYECPSCYFWISNTENIAMCKFTLKGRLKLSTLPGYKFMPCPNYEKVSLKI